MTSDDLKFYSCANSPHDDVSTLGGAIDTTIRILNTTIFTSDYISVVSSSASDIQDLVVLGRDFGGQPKIERLTLSGTTVVKGRELFDTILDVRLSSAAIGTVTIKQLEADTTWYTIAIGEKGATSIFKYSYASEGEIVTRYDKVFLKNTAAGDLSTATLELTADESGSLQVGFSGTGGTLSIANRKTAPVGITFTDGSQSIGTLSAGSTIGIWFKQELEESALPDVSSYTLNVAGNG